MWGWFLRFWGLASETLVGPASTGGWLLGLWGLVSGTLGASFSSLCFNDFLEDVEMNKPPYVASSLVFHRLPISTSK